MDSSDVLSQFNPYQAPIDVSDPKLAPDTSFMVSDQCVLCEDTLELPKVCIVSGQRSDLVKQEATLAWTPVWLHSVRIIVCVFFGIAALQMTIYLISQAMTEPAARDSIPIFLIIAAAISAGFPLVVLWGALQKTNRIRATWFVSRTLAKREQHRRRWCYIAAAIAVFTFLCGIAAGAVFSDDYFVICVWSGLLAIITVVLGRRRRQPEVVGMHEGLHVIKGLSAEFLQVTLDMIGDAERQDDRNDSRPS